jgi:hypothetical protein
MMRVRRRSAALPNPDLPEDIKRDFEEARTVLALSPRSAIALLRIEAFGNLILYPLSQRRHSPSVTRLEAKRS